MATTVANGRTTATPASGLSYPSEESAPKGYGWVLFAAIMLLVSASLNVIWGIAAVSDSHFFVAGASYILSSLNTWGWVAIGFGAIEVLAVLSIWRGGQLGRWFGIAVAAFAVPVAMLSIPAYPLWSLALVAIDLLVIYGLVVYGGRPELAR